MILLYLHPETEYLPLKHFTRDSPPYVNTWLLYVYAILIVFFVFYIHCLSQSLPYGNCNGVSNVSNFIIFKHQETDAI